jgi:hypothetical protein
LVEYKQSPTKHGSEQNVYCIVFSILFVKLIILSSVLVLVTIGVISLSSAYGLASFVDETKDPQHYVDRYQNEVVYRNWFNENYPQYSSIYEAVGLSVPKVDTSHKYVQIYKNNDYGFSMDLFNSWNVVDDGSASLETFQYSKAITGKIQPQFLVFYTQVSGVTSDVFKESLEQTFLRGLDDNSKNNLKITKVQYKEFDGGAMVSANILSTETIEGEKYIQKQKTALIYYDTGDLYALGLTTDSKDYAVVTTEFLKVLETFDVFKISEI